jgi:hypothetical protein
MFVFVAVKWQDNFTGSDHGLITVHFGHCLEGIRPPPPTYNQGSQCTKQEL